MIATSTKLFVGIPLAAGASALLVGYVLSGASGRQAEATPPAAAAIPANAQPRGKAPRRAWRPGFPLRGQSLMKTPGRLPVRGHLREWSVYRVREIPPK